MYVQDFQGTFSRGTSHIDWCEDNYTVASSVAEFYNTVSNAPFFTVPPLLLYLFRRYARHVSPGVNLVWILLVVVGLGSAYFHATLSLAGQLIDELAILWVLMTGVALWMPRRFVHTILGASRERFRAYVLVVGVVTSGLSLVAPVINAFILLACSVVAAVIVANECRRSRDERARRLCFRSMLIFVGAVFCWVSDRALCSLCQHANFPYLHGFWHILIFVCSYTGAVLMAFFDACNEAPHLTPRLKFWPKNEWETMGVPYVAIGQEWGKTA